MSKNIESTSPGRWRIAAIVMGNAFEWYDFTIYGYFAVIIAKLFFPPGPDWSSLSATLVIFGGSIVVRPLGGIFLGHYADLVGRKRVLVAMIGLMSLGTAMIGLAPTYATAGVAAPLIIMAARLIQSLSVGGEYGSATTFLVEIAPPARRGLYGGWQFSGQGLAILLGGIVASLLALSLSPEQMEAWGWRVPFFVGFLIGPIGIYLRFRLQESPEFLRNKAARTALPRAPIMAVLADYKRRVLIGFGLMAAGTASVYVLFIFMPTYAVRVLGLKLQTALLVPLVAGLTVSIICPIAGHLSDRFGRKRLLAGASIFLLVTLLPAFQWLHSEPSGARLVAVEILVALATATYAGPLGTTIAELFPVGVRVTAMSVAYNLGVVFFGGFAPLVVAWLIATTGDALAPAHYVMAALLVSLAALIAMPKRPPQP